MVFAYFFSRVPLFLSVLNLWHSSSQSGLPFESFYYLSDVLINTSLACDEELALISLMILTESD